MKNIWIIGILTLIVLTSGCAQPKSTVTQTPRITQTPANDMPASIVTQTHSLKYQLSANNSYVAGTPVRINFTIENLLDEDLWILKWYTPLEGIRGEIFQVNCDGKEIPYEGMMAKRGDPDRDSYMHIVPRGSVSEVVDLSGAYNIPVSNECQVEFKGRIFDVLSSEDKLPRRSDEHQGMDITGNKVAFRVFDH
jgi:peptidyl-Lys metalloendopeptidase